MKENFFQNIQEIIKMIEKALKSIENAISKLSKISFYENDLL